MTAVDKEYVDAKFDSLKQYIDTRVAHGVQELKTELHQTIAQTVKWSAAIAASTLMIFVTVVVFLMNNAVPRPLPVQQAAPAPAPAAVAAPIVPQPIVIVIPLKS
ncbi:hypothetical protein [Pseudoduganella sp. RAF53_2]|uniref:hypothetical protein n=1 Tax=unclassified Pseudoduganella TaxID=2637179 RepID=UPI003F97DFCC